MKKLEKFFARIICVALIGVLILGAVPLRASAAQTVPFVICMAAQEDEVADMRAGFPVVSGEYQCILTTAHLYQGDEYSYVGYFGGEDFRQLDLAGEGSGVLLFEASELKTDECYKMSVPVVGEKVKLIAVTKELKLVSTYTTIEEYIAGSGEKEADLYELRLGKIENLGSDLYIPALILNEKGEMVAVYTDNNGMKCYSFAEPVGGAPDQPTRPTRPVPETETTVPKTDPTEPTRPKGDPTGDEDDFLIYIVGGVALIAVGLFLLLRKKETPAAPADGGSNPNRAENKAASQADYPATKPVVQPEYPETRPAAEKKENLGGWETVPEEKPSISIALVGVGGVMNGRSYRVGDESVLIGRAENANIRYPAETKGVSRRHCQVLWKNGVLVVMDLGSTAGTYLNGKNKLPANTPVPVTEGDVIYLGSKENGLRIETR